jgi:peptidyl-tRNA hydrolase, PTH1 family
MLLVCGLGNVGEKYLNTRHNAGFLFLKHLSCAYGFCFKESKNLQAQSLKHSIDGCEVLLMKPTTFMNNSGLAVASVMKYYKIPSESVLIVHDDLDLPLGSVRIKLAGGSAGHNGIKSIDAAIGNNYWRMRIGIGRPLQHVEISDYVLEKFSNTELCQVEKTMSLCRELFCNFITTHCKS